VRLPAATDVAAALAAASTAAAVDGFRFEPPSLSDLFMEPVRL